MTNLPPTPLPSHFISLPLPLSLSLCPYTILPSLCSSFMNCALWLSGSIGEEPRSWVSVLYPIHYKQLVSSLPHWLFVTSEPCYSLLTSVAAEPYAHLSKLNWYEKTKTILVLVNSVLVVLTQFGYFMAVCVVIIRYRFLKTFEYKFGNESVCEAVWMIDEKITLAQSIKLKKNPYIVITNDCEGYGNIFEN